MALFRPGRDGEYPVVSIVKAEGSGRAAAELTSPIVPVSPFVVKAHTSLEDGHHDNLIKVPNIGILTHLDGSMSWTNGGDDDHSIIRPMSQGEAKTYVALGRPTDVDGIAAAYFTSVLTS